MGVGTNGKAGMTSCAPGTPNAIVYAIGSLMRDANERAKGDELVVVTFRHNGADVLEAEKRHDDEVEEWVRQDSPANAPLAVSESDAKVMRALGDYDDKHHLAATKIGSAARRRKAQQQAGATSKKYVVRRSDGDSGKDVDTSSASDALGPPGSAEIFSHLAALHAAETNEDGAPGEEEQHSVDELSDSSSSAGTFDSAKIVIEAEHVGDAFAKLMQDHRSTSPKTPTPRAAGELKVGIDGEEENESEDEESENGESQYTEGEYSEGDDENLALFTQLAEKHSKAVKEAEANAKKEAEEARLARKDAARARWTRAIAMVRLDVHSKRHTNAMAKLRLVIAAEEAKCAEAAAAEKSRREEEEASAAVLALAQAERREKHDAAAKLGCAFRAISHRRAVQQKVEEKRKQHESPTALGNKICGHMARKKAEAKRQAEAEKEQGRNKGVAPFDFQEISSDPRRI